MGASPVRGGSGPSLPQEDRAEFERVVDEALRSGALRRALRAAPPGTADRLRERARACAEDLAAVVAAEHRELSRVRRSAPPAGGAPPRTPSGGGGLLAALAVLVPLVAAAAAVIFLVLGYAMMLLDARRDTGASLVVTGWSGAGVAAVTGALGLGKLVATARRGDGGPGGRHPAGPAAPGEEPYEVEAAHLAWRTALLERAVLPYLTEHLRRAGREEDERRPTPPAPVRPTPPASGPDRTDPGGTGPGDAAPEFTSPGFTSPDFAGPGFAAPGFAGPDPGRAGTGAPRGGAVSVAGVAEQQAVADEQDE
ncbi:hypothetical protein FM076_03185 [Streptomyces albus subsp. chlorinus]|uniref:hypothetical protein n=1 Tax=Streptomyces albus TaxID=1888 RepID=UPI001570A655|nr:hypothetical protein [Streptomyces albus]NSC20269.1 hypothetical protein [Streptomyces albus subsp. chlorinus]